MHSDVPMEMTHVRPGWVMPESRLFAYPTRMADSWQPAPERIIQPAETFQDERIVLRVEGGCTRDTSRSRHPLRRLRRLGTTNLPDTFIFDARDCLDVGNMAHLLCQLCPRVLLAQRILREKLQRDVRVHLLVRSDMPATAGRVCDILGIPVVCTDRAVRANIVTFPNTRSDALISPELPELYANKIADYVPTTPQNVFISRRGTRGLLNESEVWGLLKERGFQRFYFEDIPVNLQWSLVCNAHSIVAVHGAALGALVFPRPDLHPGASGRRVIELFGAGYIVRVFRKMATAAGDHWCAIRGQVTPEVVRDLDFRQMARSHAGESFRVDLQTLRMALDYSEISRMRPAKISPALRPTTGAPNSLIRS